MKKRVLSLVLAVLMIASLLPTSALASVYQPVDGDDAFPKVVFYNGETEISEQNLKSADTVIYDPGVPALEEHQAFDGWCLKQDFSDDAMTIQGVRDYVKANYATMGELKLYAKVVTTYHVSYVADGIVQKMDTVTLPAGETSFDHSISAGYSPAKANQQFRGWDYNGTLKQVGEVIKVDPAADVELTANIAEGYWITFHENEIVNGVDIHSSYQKPVLLANGESINLADYPVSASGYRFLGWYDKNDKLVEGYASGELKADVDLYAKWEQVSTSDYRVIIWKQNIEGNGYDYAETVTLSGKPGDVINTVSQQGSGNNAYAKIGNENYRYTGFHLNKFDQDVTIAPQGTSVVNVYYDRTEYTLKFQENTGIIISNWKTVKEIKALYGQDISSNFPITNDGARWDPQNSSTYSYVLVYIPYMPAENITFHRNDASYSTKHMYYYVEVLPGDTDTNTVTYGGKTFKLYGKPIDANYKIITKEEDFVTLNGYDKYASDPSFGTGTEVEADKNNSIRFYYTRTPYNIEFMDGTYIKQTSDGPEILTGYSQGQFTPPSSIPAKNIPFESDLSAYNAGGNMYFVPTAVSGFTFAGWYKDPACTEPYTFTTMPVNGITVYAKWILNRYQVEIMNGEESVNSFKVDYHETVGLPSITKEGYTLVGWFSDEDFTHPYNENTKVDDNTTDLDKTFTEDGVKGKLTIYAQWRAALEEPGYINVNYESDHSTAPKDNSKYADQSQAKAAAAPSDVEAGYTFECWALLSKDGSEAARYYPGQPFTVEVAKAVYNAGDPSYTVTLKAIFEETANNKTFLKYDLNGGGTFKAGGDTVTINDIPLNSTVTLKTQDEFDTTKTFLGWNQSKTEADASIVEFEAGQKVGVDNLKDPANTLYAVYAASVSKVIDFNGKMVLAKEANAPERATSNNGVFGLSGTDAYYQLNSGSLKDSTKENSASLNNTYKGTDSAAIYGKHIGESEKSWKDITVVPASNIYYSDTLVNTKLDVNDQIGYNEGVKHPEVTAASDSKTYSFTFTGTRIDVYATTSKDTGAVTAKLKDSDGNVVKNGMKIINTKVPTDAIRVSAPSVSFSVPSGTYTLEIYANELAYFALEAVRVYNATEDNAAVEPKARYINLRDMVLGKKEAGELTDKTTGALFMDKYTGTNPYEEGTDAYDKYVPDDYTNLGPKNEVYLAKDQSIAFVVPDGVDVMVSARSPETPSGTVMINREPQPVNNVDMYYPVTPDGEGKVVIENTTNDMISVLNVKLTAADDTVTMTLFSSPQLVSSMAHYVGPVSADNTQAAQQALTELIQQILSNFVRALFENVSRLFGK